MICLHYLNNSRAQRILWLLEALELDYQVQIHERDKKTSLAPQEFKQIHALGKFPVIVDGDKTIAESGLIIDYLIRNYGGESWQFDFNSDEYNQQQYWLHYGEGSLMPPMLMQLVFNMIQTKPMPFFIKPIVKKIAQAVEQSFIHPNLDTHFQFIEKHLQAKTWFVGERLSGADIQMSFPLEAAVGRVNTTSMSKPFAEQYPNINAYVKRVHAHPAYQKALAAGTKYDYQ